MKWIEESDAANDTAESDRGGSGGNDNKLIEKIAAILGKRNRHKAFLEKLDRTGREQISLTDPDSRRTAPGVKVGIGYNIQLAIDAKWKLIVAVQEVSNDISDRGLSASTVKVAMEALGVKQLDAAADRGYFSIDDIDHIDPNHRVAALQQPLRRVKAHKFGIAGHQHEHQMSFISPIRWHAIRSNSDRCGASLAHRLLS